MQYNVLSLSLVYICNVSIQFLNKGKNQRKYNELLYDSSVLNFNCVEECIFPSSTKVISLKKVHSDIYNFVMIQIL